MSTFVSPLRTHCPTPTVLSRHCIGRVKTRVRRRGADSGTFCNAQPCPCTAVDNTFRVLFPRACNDNFRQQLKRSSCMVRRAGNGENRR